MTRNKIFTTLVSTFFITNSLFACIFASDGEQFSKLKIEHPVYNATLDNCFANDVVALSVSWTDVNAKSYSITLSNPAGSYDLPDVSTAANNKQRSLDITNRQLYECFEKLGTNVHGKNSFSLKVVGTTDNGDTQTDSCKVSVSPEYNLDMKNYRIRDPFVTVDRENKCYYIVTSTWVNNRGALKVLKSGDLEHWKEDGMVFQSGTSYLGTDDYWAPDTYEYKGSYYTFVTVRNSSKGILRGTTILKSTTGVAGKYAPVLLSNRLNVTPATMQCLDGSLYVDGDGTPWMIFSLEWNGPNVTHKVGEVWAMKLKSDLSDADGSPVRLFKATDAPWVSNYANTCYVTDAPFIWKDEKTGNLIMTWSSFTAGDKYAIGQAVSTNGVLGPWKHESEPIFANNGGHAMVFKDLNGKLKISFHCPNSGSTELLTIKDIEIKNGKFKPLK